LAFAFALFFFVFFFFFFSFLNFLKKEKKKERKTEALLFFFSKSFGVLVEYSINNNLNNKNRNLGFAATTVVVVDERFPDF